VHFSAPLAAWLADADPRRVVLVVEAFEGEVFLSRALHYFGKTRELELPDPELSCTVVDSDESWACVAVTARRLAQSVRLLAEPAAGGDADGHFADNYFDMLPGETVAVDWRGAPGVVFRAQSIRDTY
jgi:beta-mannosidase